MSENASRHMLILGLIAMLHLPLLYFSITLYYTLPPGQGIGDLPLGSLFTIIALAALPYIVLALAGIRWNPPRARLGEFDC